MKRHFLIIVFTSTMLSMAGNFSAQQTMNDTISYPIVDVTTGVGFMWLLQFNLTISPFDHVFLQPRVSVVPLLAYDIGGNIGYQIRYKNDAILRFGIGYSLGEAIPFYVTGDLPAKSDKWQSVYLRVGILGKISKHAVFNPNINITRIETRPIFSFNITLGYSIFR